MTRLFTRLSAVALGAIALAVAGLPARAATPADTLVIADRIDDIVSLDPAEVFEFAGGDATRNIYDKLVDFDPKKIGPLVPSLAESWTVSDDGMTYVFKIRKGPKFHSGNPVTAADAEFSLRRAIILKKTPSFILTQFGFTADNVKDRIRATGAYELTVTVDKPYAPSFFLNCLTATIGLIVDKKLAMSHEQNGDLGYEWLKTHSAGSGPFKLRAWKPNESYVLDRNDDYWRGKVTMKRVIVRHVAEAASQRLLVEKGDVDIARGLSPDDIAAIRGNPDVKIEEDLKGRIWYFSMNQKNPILSNPDVVKAMKYLVDYQGIAKSVLRGQVVVHQAYLPRTYLGEIRDTPYSLDVAKAKALLAKAGYPDGFETTMHVRNASERLEVAQAMQATFAKAGIKIKLITGTGKQTLAAYRARKHDIYMGLWGPDYPDPHTNADTFADNPDNRDEAKLTGKLAWRNSYFDPEMNKLTQAAVLERDTDKRRAMYETSQRKFQKEAPFGVMFQQIIQTAMRKNVKNFVTGGAIANTYYWITTK